MGMTETLAAILFYIIFGCALFYFVIYLPMIVYHCHPIQFWYGLISHNLNNTICAI